ncbi:MAG: hypothetical protein JO336_23430 [Acidobacteriia bacterium]|nr:hypothetical protein [Terriglobia bacterium]
MKTFSRVLGPALLLAWSALAAPPLTTIDDVLYKADGTRFNGDVTITWMGFQAPDQSNIATQVITTKIVNGHLHLQLVPTASANPEVFYTATYNSDGLVQFTETWSVPPSTRSLKLKDIRVPPPLITGIGNDTGATGPVPESDVTGLLADLSARPVVGPAFAPGAVAVVNTNGSIDSVAGNPADCVHVNGSSGPCGSASLGFMDGDMPSGIVDGSNNLFALSAVPNPATSLYMYRNGLLEQQGTDYTLVNGNLVQFAPGTTPQPGDTLLAHYRLMDGTNGAPQLYPTPQILCSGTGASVNTTTLGSLGACTIPRGILNVGDRVEIKFDLAHLGSAGGFTFQVQWGATTVLQRTAAAGDGQVSGHADAGLDAAGAQVSTQSWGTVLPFNATIGNATDSYANGLVISFSGSMGGAVDTLTLRNYAVVRLP